MSEGSRIRFLITTLPQQHNKTLYMFTPGFLAYGRSGASDYMKTRVLIRGYSDIPIQGISRIRKPFGSLR